MITAENLTKRFNRGVDTFEAVSDLSFSVQPGEVFGLLGPNGAGKTTTLRMILGLVEPTSGKVTVDGFDVEQKSEEVKRRIGYASVSVGVYPWLSAREMLMFVSDLYDLDREYAHARIDYLAETLSFTSLLDRRCATLSTGEKQRVNLARGLVHEPPAMLLDEPTTGLDVLGSSVVFDYLDYLRQQNKAVIVCTHRLDEAQRICDRFGLLHRGRIAREGDFATLQKETGKDNLVEMFYDLMEIDESDAAVGAAGWPAPSPTMDQVDG